MAADLVQAVFSGATPGSDLTAFLPSVGSGLIRHPSYANSPMIATASKRFRAGSAGIDTVYLDQTTTSGADYSVRLKVTALSLTGADILGPTIRTSGTSDSFYTLVWINFNGLANGLTFYKHSNGSPSQISGTLTTLNGVSTIPTEGTSALLEISVSGTTITGSFNGVPAITITDSEITSAGFGGIYIRSGASDDNSGIQAEEFTINDPAASSGSSGGTGSGSGTNSSTPLKVAVTSLGHWCSPLNWDDDGSGPKLANGVRAGASTIWSACNGAQGRFAWTTSTGSGNVATLNIDTSFLIAGSIAPASFPRIKYRINDGAYQVAQIQPGTGGASTLDVTAAGVSGAGTYTLHYTLMATSQAEARWNPTPNSVVPPNSLKITGMTLDPGSTLVAPAVLGRTLAVFGDSITEGVRATGTANGDLASNDSTLTYAQALAAGLGAELAVVGFGGQGWEDAGGGGIPPFPGGFPLYSANRLRDFSPKIDFVVCTHGTNDGLNGSPDAVVANDSAAWLRAARTKFGPDTKIFLCVPFGGFKRAGLTAGFQQYQAATPDSSAFFIDGGPSLQAGLTAFSYSGGTWSAPCDGIHPDPATHARIASVLEEAIDAAMGGYSPPPPPPPVNPESTSSLTASGTTFAQLQSGGLSGQMESLLAANPTLNQHVIDGLRAGRTGSLDKTYQGLSSLVESYLRGDPISSAEINTRLCDYATVFAGYAQTATEIATLAEVNPGKIVNLPNSPHATVPISHRTFS